MSNVLERKVLSLALLAGEIMLKSGAEIYRVEDTITRICRACKMDNVGVFSTLTGIFVSVSRDREDSHSSTAIANVKTSSINLNKISKVNSFARTFIATDLSVDEGIEILEKIKTKRLYPVPFKIFISGISCALFSVIFGGLFSDSILTGFIGLASYSIFLGLAALNTNYFLCDFLAIAFAAFACLAASHFDLISTSGPAIIGSLMLFAPGFSITTSMRDFLSGDMLAGLSRLVEALAIAISLAAGVGFALQIWNYTGGLFQ